MTQNLKLHKPLVSIGGSPIPDRVVQFISRSPREEHPYLHPEELPERDRAHAAVGARRVRGSVPPGRRACRAVPAGPALPGPHLEATRQPAARCY